MKPNNKKLRWLVHRCIQENGSDRSCCGDLVYFPTMFHAPFAANGQGRGGFLLNDEKIYTSIKNICVSLDIPAKHYMESGPQHLALIL